MNSETQRPIGESESASWLRAALALVVLAGTAIVLWLHYGGH